jgi:hypothetical protein
MPRRARGFRKGALVRMMMVKGIVRAAMMGVLAKKPAARGRMMGGGGGRLRGFR